MTKGKKTVNQNINHFHLQNILIIIIKTISSLNITKKTVSLD